MYNISWIVLLKHETSYRSDHVVPISGLFYGQKDANESDKRLINQSVFSKDSNGSSCPNSGSDHMHHDLASNLQNWFLSRKEEERGECKGPK